MTEKIYKKLPEVLQTSAVKNFFESTVEQLFSKANTEQLQGFIGYKTKEDAGVKGAFISEPTATRRFYSVSPVANNINPQTNQSENIVFYDEFIDTLATYGVDVRNQNKLFGEKFSTFMPPVDVDKLINYQEYYWYPDGPSTINISGTLAKPIDIDRDILGRVSYTSPNNKKFRNGMIIKFDGQYVIPSSEVGVEYIVEGVGEGIYLVPKSDNFSTRFSTPVNDLFDPAIINLDDPNVTHSAGNVSSVTILNGGIGYSNSDILVFSGTANTQATGNIIVDGNGSVTSIVITSSGNHYSDHVSATISSATGSGFVGGVVLDEMHEFLNADFVGSISGNVLTVSSVTSGALAANMYLIGTGIDAGTYIVSGAGTTWYLNQSLTATGSITITGNTVNILDTQIKFGVNPNTGKYYLTGDTVNGFDGEASTWGGGLSQSAADYILIRRGAANKNIWSRVNFWYHRDNFKDAGDELPSSAYRAARPIIEFDHRIELYNHGVNGIGGVNIASTNLSYADVNGSRTGLLIDDVPSERALIVFPTEPASVAKYIYQAITNTATNLIELKRVGDPVLNPTGAVDGDADFVPWEMTVGDVVQIKNGNLNTGKEYRYTSNGLVLCQEKLTINQDPLFNLYDDTGVALDDPGKYPNATFTGNAIFGYMRNIDELYNVTELNAKQSPVEDSVLGFKLYYKGFKASSEIAFKNHLGIEHHYYVPLGQVGQEFIPGYYFYKLTNNSVDEFHYDWKTVSKPSQQKIYTSYTLSQFDIDRGSVTFFIGCEPRFNVDVNSSYEITVTVNGINREDFT